ncbi:hypothetical protein CYY_002929 [Polysphondylium violaceum]|uniref:E3 ubiquitin-protein ligase n=1 Tax=Polysphondylium violaceum TaxID=133409 RepID=A0A8J4Q0G2_9MYCE|nr:hypothetical protein CYY_002929 [Polysphondylium violaceum]
MITSLNNHPKPIQVVPVLTSMHDAPFNYKYCLESYLEVKLKSLKERDIDNFVASLSGETILTLIEKTFIKLPFCQQEWTANSYFFKCNDCSIEKNSSVCVNCFKKSDHLLKCKSFSLEKSLSGGCCDCGNSDCVIEESFCKDHSVSEDPSSQLDEKTKKSLHVTIRLLVLFILRCIDELGATPVNDRDHIQVLETIKNIFQWFEKVSKQSYSILYIIAQEFSGRSLKENSFEIYKPIDLPFLDMVPYNFNENAIYKLLLESKKFPQIIDYFMPLAFTFFGNKIFKIIFLEELLKFFKDFSLDQKLSSQKRSLVEQLIPLQSISFPFINGQSKQNIFIVIFNTYTTIFKKVAMINLKIPSQRSSLNLILDDIVEFRFFPELFKKEQIVNQIYENDEIIRSFLQTVNEIQFMDTFTRSIDKADENTLPSLLGILSIEGEIKLAFGNLFKTLHKYKFNTTEKYFDLIVRGFQISSPNQGYHFCDGLELPNCNILKGIEPLSLYTLRYGIVHVFFSKIVFGSPDFSFNYLNSNFDRKTMILLTSKAIIRSVYVSQYESNLWKRNGVDIYAQYIWLNLELELFFIQLMTILLGPKTIITLCLSSFSSNFQHDPQYKNMLPHFLRFLIFVLQYRHHIQIDSDSQKYHLIQHLASGPKTYTQLKDCRPEYWEGISEDSIDLVAHFKESDKKYHLKPTMWERYDPYYPFYYEKESKSKSMENFWEHLKQKNHISQESYPLPCKIDTLHDNMKQVLSLLQEPLLYEMFSCNISSLISLPTVKGKTVKYRINSDSELIKFVQNEIDYQVNCLESENNEPYYDFQSGNQYLDSLLNHSLYTIVMALKLFIETNFKTMDKQTISKIHRCLDFYFKDTNRNTGKKQEFDSFLSEMNVSYTMNPILCLLKPFTFIVDDGVENDKSEFVVFNLIDLVIMMSVKMENENHCKDKKDLFHQFYSFLNQINNTTLENHLLSSINLKSFLSDKDLLEAQERKKKALQKQTEIKEKIRLQQQSISLDKYLSYEEESFDPISPDNNTDGQVCVVCKLHSPVPLCEIGYVSNSAVKRLSIRETKSQFKDPGHYLEAVGDELLFYQNTWHDFNLYSIFYIIQFGCSTFAQCCGHVIHKSCLEQLHPSVLKQNECFYCPMCKRVSNFILSTKVEKMDSDFANSLAMTFLLHDLTNVDPPPKNKDIYKCLLWKYIISNIENLELLTRPNHNYLEGLEKQSSFGDYQNPMIFSETEFKRHLKTLHLIYVNIMAITSKIDPTFFELDKNMDFFTSRDPFVLLCIRHFLYPHKDLMTETLPACFKLMVSDVRSFQYGSTQKNISYSHPLKGKESIDSYLKPFIRKAFLFIHYCIKSQESIGLEFFNNIDLLKTKLGLSSPLSLDLKFIPIPFERLFLNNFFITHLPTFTYLPSKHIELALNNLNKPLPTKKCRDNDKGFCLFCSTLVCLNDECCPQQNLIHSFGCALQSVTVKVCTPQTNVIKETPYKHQYIYDVYFDKHKQAGGLRSTSDFRLNESILRRLYVDWLKNKI